MLERLREHCEIIAEQIRIINEVFFPRVKLSDLFD